MKKGHIALIILIALGIGIIVSMYGDASTYEDFAVAADNQGKEYHVVGTLNKDKPREYDPQKNANYFSFYLIDEKGRECQVVYHAPEPADFERSEKIVIIGSMDGDVFHAGKILLKCPSKYNEGQVPQA